MNVKRFLCSLICCAMLLTALPLSSFAADTTETSQAAVFTDVEKGSQYESAITYCAANGYMVGTGEQKFEPESGVTRGIALTVLWRAFGSPIVNYAMPFTDVDENAWYADAVRWAVSENIVNGVSDTKFAPNDLITKQDLAKIVYAYEQYCGGGFKDNWMFELPFEDKADIAEYAYEAVAWLYMNKVYGTADDTKFNPNAIATRGELASVLKEYMLLNEDATKGMTPMDYSKAENWIQNDFADASKKDTKADVIFIYGTVSQVPTQENGIAEVTDEVRAGAKALGIGTADAFDDDTRMYIPCYRQVSLQKALEGIEKGHQFLPDTIKSTEAIVDLSASLDYYFKNYNEGRPFILAGYSQGGASVQALLEAYFGKAENKEYLKQLVAAYSIAYGVDKTWLDKLDYIDFATGEYDTGVLISWVTEGPDSIGGDMLVADNTANALVINPINWKTDGTYAKAEECLGTYVDGKITEKGLYNLQINAERGCLICDNNTDYVSAPGYENIWGGKSLHLYEVKQAYGSIRKNMHDRIDAFLAKGEISMVTDYTKKDNWAVFEKDGTKKVDTIYFCPSLVMSSKTGTGIGLPEEMLPGIDVVLNGQTAVFEDSTNVFVPLYRQQVFNAEILTALDMSDPVHWMFDLYSTNPGYEDCVAALDYYFENCNNGKPFILAGHSQGSALIHIILEKYMKEHPEYYERMVAAYAIGMSTPKDYMEANPHLKYATGADDTGVIISYNTEGPNAEGINFLLCKDSYLINPINWKTDDTYVSAKDNLGSYVDGEIVMNFADAKIDFKRYSIVTTANSPYGELVDYTGTKCLHGSDYQLYFKNLKENVQKRIDAFLANK